jgi:hypothetical protein
MPKKSSHDRAEGSNHIGHLAPSSPVPTMPLPLAVWFSNLNSPKYDASKMS